MKNQQLVQFAVMCLQALNENPGHALSTEEISRRQGVPLPDCVRIVRRLAHAGILGIDESGKVVLRRPIDDVTALEILEAVWSHAETRPAFRMWVGGARGLASRVTRALIASARQMSWMPSEDGQGWNA